LKIITIYQLDKIDEQIKLIFTKPINLPLT